MKILGYERNDFKVDGKDISGYYVYLSHPAIGNDSKGQIVERVYLSDQKLAANSLVLSEALGKSVTVIWNRYGKVQRIALDG